MHGIVEVLSWTTHSDSLEIVTNVHSVHLILRNLREGKGMKRVLLCTNS